MARELLTLTEVARRLGTCLETVRRAVRRGDLPAVKVDGKSYRVRRADLAAYLDARTTGGAR